MESSSNPTIDALLAHRSVRHFAPEPLPAGLLERLVSAGQQAATSSNLQTWSVIALQDPAHKAEAATICGDQQFIRDAPLFLVFCADLARLKSISDSVEQPGAGLDYLEMFLTGVIDAALAAQNIAVAAESEGLGICYVGAARNTPKALAAHLKLPPRVFAVFGMAIGFPAPNDTSAVKPRLPQSAVLHHETYNPDAWESAVVDYNTAMEVFNAMQNRTVRGDWAQHSARRVGTAAALMGRDTLLETLHELGFELR